MGLKTRLFVFVFFLYQCICSGFSSFISVKLVIFDKDLLSNSYIKLIKLLNPLVFMDHCFDICPICMFTTDFWEFKFFLACGTGQNQVSQKGG